MAYLQKDINDMYRRALAALSAEFSDLPANSVGKEAAEGLREKFALIESAGGAKAAHHGSAQAGTAQRAVARRNLYEYQQTLAKTANTISRRTPGFNRHFPAPTGKTDQQLLTEARAAVPEAVAQKAEFVRFGLKADFVESGTELIEAFAGSFETTDTALASRSAAVGTKKEAEEDADDYFDELDRFIRNYYRDQPAKLSAWKTASHIERASKKEKDKPQA